MKITRNELEQLRAKYVAIIRLREENSTRDPGRPPPALAALAAEFPGALREIDDLPMDLLRSRVEAVVAAEEDPSRVERWMIAVATFHRLTRGALAAKRWLDGTKEVDDDLRKSFDFATKTLPWGEDARVWVDELDRIASPPQGKITQLVFERLGRSLEASPSEAKALVFGPARRQRTT